MLPKHVSEAAGHGCILGAIKILLSASTPNQDNPLMDISPVKGTPLLDA